MVLLQTLRLLLHLHRALPSFSFSSLPLLFSSVLVLIFTFWSIVEGVLGAFAQLVLQGLHFPLQEVLGEVSFSLKEVLNISKTMGNISKNQELFHLSNQSIPIQTIQLSFLQLQDCLVNAHFHIHS
jgi:hypothetical protein